MSPRPGYMMANKDSSFEVFLFGAEKNPNHPHSYPRTSPGMISFGFDCCIGQERVVQSVRGQFGKDVRSIHRKTARHGRRCKGYDLEPASRIRPATSPLINAKTDGSTYRQDMLLQLPQT